MGVKLGVGLGLGWGVRRVEGDVFGKVWEEGHEVHDLPFRRR